VEPIQIVAGVIFLASVVALITGIIDSVIAALLGVFLMVITQVMTEVDAFKFVDWNVICILLGIWVIAGYFGKTGIPEYLSSKILRISRGNVAIFVTLLGTLAGFISMFVDNVVVVLMMAPIVFTVTRQIKFPAFPAVLFVGLCANFMGTALLLGDLPPQMLHSVSGIEFSGFIWHSGRPASFPILTLTYLCVVAIFFFRFIKVYGPKAMPSGPAVDTTSRRLDHFVKDRVFTFTVLSFFLATIVAMSLRKVLGWHLGFIALMGATLLILTLEVLHKRQKLSNPSFEEILAEMDWRAIFFYVSLFALVGGLEKAGIIKALADWLVPYIKGNLLAGFSLLYWATVPIVGLVEHDAYILTFLYVIRDLGTYHGINPWPLWWGLLWAGTLGSNLTIAGAPALFVALNCSQKEDACKINLKEFLSYSVPYVLSSTVICFILALLVWVLPYINH